MKYQESDSHPDQMITVTAGILIRDHKVLIAKRPAGKHLAGYWEFPGGKTEPGETYEESLVREFREEFGMAIHVISPYHENIHGYPSGVVRLIAFLVGQAGGEMKAREHDEVRWVHPRDLLHFQLSPADIPIAEKLASDLRE